MNPTIPDHSDSSMPPIQDTGTGSPHDPTVQGPAPLGADAMSSAQPQAAVGQAGSQYAPGAAEDADLIEKEWVTRAKMIVAKTRDDPREQNKEISKFKADYLRKRYNKDIKVSEV